MISAVTHLVEAISHYAKFLLNCGALIPLGSDPHNNEIPKTR